MSNAFDTLGTQLGRFKEESQKFSNLPFEFSLKPDTQSKIVLLGNGLYTRYEHEFFIKNYKGDLRQSPIECFEHDDEGDCPMCDYRASNKNGPVQPRTLVGYITALELVTVKSQSSDKTFVNPRRTVRMKSQTLESLKLIYEENDEDLTGLTVTVKRSKDSQSPRAGDIWLPSKRLSAEEIKKLNKDESTEINFAEELPKFSPQKVSKIIRLWNNAAMGRVEGEEGEGEEQADPSEQRSRPKTWG